MKFYDTLNINRNLLIFNFKILILFVLFLQTPGYSTENPGSFADLAEKLTPSVVNISTTMVIKKGKNLELPQFPEGSPFEEFFKEFEDKGRKRGENPESLGSGFIIDEKGIVVTNNHVIENGEKITVQLSNKKRFEAKIIGRDVKTDIAVLKINPEKTKLNAVTFADSDKLRVGDWVMAIGNPFGLGGTVTAGIVSARGRDINAGPYDDYIQTDASINRGNSGGPLFNLKGEVVGINTAIYSTSGGSVGIGFAISANLAKKVVKQLEDFGRTRRGWLGVYIQEITEDIAESLELKEVAGALVSSVTKDGPAEKAGVEAGDVIISFNNKKVEKSRDLPRIVAETAVNEIVDVKLIRNGKNVTLKVKLGELEQAESSGLLLTDNSKSEKIENLGIKVSNLDETISKKFNLEINDIPAVVITEVQKDSIASDKGLIAGDIIRRINQKKINSVKELMLEINKALDEKRKGILMLIETNKKTRFVQLSFE